MEILLLAHPWESGSSARSCLGGRPCITVQGDEVQVASYKTSESLPRVGKWTDNGGRSWGTFELPATCVARERGRNGSITEDLALVVRESLQRQEVVIRQERGIPRPAERQSIEEQKEQDVYDICSALAADMVDSHVDFINRLMDGAGDSANEMAWEGEARGVVLRAADRVLDKWQAGAERDEPRMALIVKLSKDLKDLLPDVCHRPRVVLTRRRDLLDVAHIQEIDAGSLRWIGKQPGITIAEKAGARQQLMGVVRLESADTLENRVVRDLIGRALAACDRYLFEHRRYQEHERVKRVRDFRSTLLMLLRDSAIAQVNPPVGMPSPNYVLLHDRRYQVLWRAYVMLVRQERQQDIAWRWQHRVWAEHCQLALLASLKRTQSVIDSAHSDVLIRSEQEWGRFLDQDTHMAPLHADGRHLNRYVDFVDGRCLEMHPLIPSELLPLCPDSVLVLRSRYAKQAERILAIWCVFDFDIEQDALSERVASLSLRLERMPHGLTVSGLIIQPDIGGSSAGHHQVGTVRCTGVRLSTRMQKEVVELARLVGMALGLQQGLNNA